MTTAPPKFDISKVPFPAAIGCLPRDSRGLPIPKTVFIPPTYSVDKKVDFRETDEVQRGKCIKERLCGICGQYIPVAGYFIGGPGCLRTHLFVDPPMHRLCALFAMKVCPFLYNKDWKGSPKYPEGTRIISDLVKEGRPDVMYLMRATQWQPATVNDKPEIYAMAAELIVVQEF